MTYNKCHNYDISLGKRIFVYGEVNQGNHLNYDALKQFERNYSG